VLVEAMAAGTCIVASGLAGYRNVATNDVDAVLVEPGDAEALAAALRRVLTDRPLAQRLTASGQQRAEEFSMVTLAERYAAIYRRVAPAPSRARRPLSPWPVGPLSPRLRRGARMMDR
jgi:phosphatidylinositol alpha-mannosyltransferase